MFVLAQVNESSVVVIPIGLLVTATIVILGALTAQVVTGFRSRRTHNEVDEIHQLLKSLDPVLRLAAASTDRLDVVHLGPNAIDEDGAPKWYVRKSLEEAMLKLDATIDKFGERLGSTFNSLDRTLDGMYREMKALREDVSKLPKA